MYKLINENLYLIGLSATIIGALRFIPLVLEIYRSKRTNNFTFGTLTFAITSTLLWITYSYFRHSISLAISASIALSVYMYIVYMKVKHN